MFVVVVQLPISKRSREAAIASAQKTAATYTSLASQGLIRKYYINGDEGAGGVYLWRSEAAARAWYTPEWERRMTETHGVKPKVTYYESLFVVDNETGEARTA
ncbi:monooxygenase [Bradyrhizobium sp. SBR1B]|uniref:monooxygenase n=1 Tax=Bradyrhizobium sp. SBR1B TaxID=2663836 RepID=UPI001606CEA2|nr:monooxygenase [Bradyrhizobium sp. SBR1B]MBB4381099.1 hypothetical protein [Bradyrhizobium sp. SBR1B]